MSHSVGLHLPWIACHLAYAAISFLQKEEVRSELLVEGIVETRAGRPGTVFHSVGLLLSWMACHVA